MCIRDSLNSALYKAATIAYNHSASFEEAYRLYNRYVEQADDPLKKYDASLSALRSAVKSNNQIGTIKYAEIILNSPDAQDPEKGLAHYSRAKVFEEKSDVKNALVDYNQATLYLTNEQAAESRFKISDIYYKQQQIDLAESFAQKALDLNAAYPFWRAKTILLLADIYRDKGDFLSARAALNAVLQYYTEDADITTVAEAKLRRLDIIEQNQSRVAPPDTQSTIELQPYEE